METENALPEEYVGCLEFAYTAKDDVEAVEILKQIQKCVANVKQITPENLACVVETKTNLISLDKIQGDDFPIEVYKEEVKT